jgi:ABC-type antimicrobial peptide transport system permease subunit
MNVISIAYKNLKRKKIRSALTIGGVAIAVAVLVSLIGFDRGYQKSLTGNIDKMGYQLLVTAKGCPYEAATMMLKGGGGLRYMDQHIYEKIQTDARIDKITPQLVSTVYDPDRLDGQGGFAMYMGITDSYLELKLCLNSNPANGLPARPQKRPLWAMRLLKLNSGLSVTKYSFPK